jgi:hypothetical protein
MKENLATVEPASLSLTEDVASDLRIQSVKQPGFHWYRLSLSGGVATNNEGHLFGAMIALI